MPANKSWSTKNEIEYLKGLVSGKWRAGFVVELSNKQLLTNYIKRAKDRIVNDTFGDVNRSDVLKYANGLMEAL